MRINTKSRIPNIAVYFALYAIIFGISLWLLIFHKDNPNNWFLYLAMGGAVLAGLLKFAWQARL